MTATMLIALLERERFNTFEGDALDRSYRKGWNDRANSLIRILRVEAGLEELAWAPTWDRRPTLPGVADIDDKFDRGGQE